MNNKKEKKLLTVYHLYILIPGIIVASVLTLALLFIVLYGLTSHIVFIILAIVIGVIALGAYITFYILFQRRLHINYYDKIFKVTYDNIDRIKRNDINLESYGDTDIKEIKMLDEATKQIKEKLACSYLVSKKADYSKLSLEYVGKSKDLVTFDSFKKNIRNIIMVSQSFRNVLIEVYFRFSRNLSLNDEQKARVLKLYKEAFKEHDHVLYTFEEDDKSLIIYIPVIDSFSEIKEKLQHVVTQSSVMVRDETGVRNIPAQYAVVAYPYSSEDMILGDLRYAKRANKPYFLFLPNRIGENQERIILKNNSMDLNYNNKIISTLSLLDYSSKNNEENISILKDALNSLKDYLEVDECGIIDFDKIDRKYYSYIRGSNSSLFEKGEIDPDFIHTLSAAVDDDQSYYFSTRNHASYELQRQIDLRGISSGYFYIIKSFESDEITQIFYVFNKNNRHLTLNSYLRESLFMMSLRLESYFEKKEIYDYSNLKDDESENVLTLSNLYTYHVDDEYRISRMSSNLHKAFSKAKIGEHCYKVFFNAEKPCRGCPLHNYKKRYFEFKGKRYEVSTVLTNRRTRDKALCLKEADEGFEHTNLFQDNLLVYSYKSFFETMQNEFVSKGRGYTLLLSIDNYSDFVSKQGSEVYEYVIRNFVRNIKNKLNTTEIYYYNPTTLAVHLPYDGHADVIDKIETIYPLSKENALEDGQKSDLVISYLSVGYPRGYAEPEDYFRHLSDFYHSDEYERNKDFIYFADFKITRSASKHDFMVSVLEDEFSSGNSNSMNLQPIVRAKDRHIFGAEILLRINDVHRNIIFNANEISRIAEQEKKTYLITNSIINFIGNLYKEHGKGTFRINKFNRIAINIDKTYLNDDKVISDMIRLFKENNLPKGFVSLEIPEDIIPNNLQSIKKLVKSLASYDINLSCDRYLGEYVDAAQLKELGFAEVKFARDIIMKIDTDPVKYQDLVKLVNEAKTFGVHTAAVGVENETQFKLLRDADENMMVQGYYLYKPLTRSDLIAALISYEN